MGRRFTVHHQCPSCGSSTVRRSSRRESDRYVMHLMRSPYRCRACGTRFWAVSTRTWALVAGATLLVSAVVASNAVWDMYDQLSTATENAERFDPARTGSAKSD